MVERNRATPEDSRIEFRIGINLGDVIIEGDDIYGDGVNIAARLEGIAEPGAIFVSRAVRDHVRDKLEVALEDLGEQIRQKHREAGTGFPDRASERRPVYATAVADTGQSLDRRAALRQHER